MANEVQNQPAITAPQRTKRRPSKNNPGVPYAGATSGENARAEATKILRRLGCEQIGFMATKGRRHDMAIGYETMGDGAHKVIALHGWFGDHTTFQPLREALSLSEFTYASVAYRGYGISRQISGNYTMKEIAADVLEVADKLGWNEFSLIGHSMGGMAVQRILADAPARVRRLVAVTPVPASGVPFDEQGWHLFSGAPTSRDNRRLIIDFSTGNRLSKAWIDHMARYSEETSTREAFAGYLQAWAKTDFHTEIEGKTLPVKVIVGANDGALTADVMKATYLAWYPNASLEVMPNAGHYPMNETPVALATSIEAFLRG